MRVGLREESGSPGYVITDLRGEKVGSIDYSVNDAGWLDVRWIELAAQHRRWGLGAEAVRLLEVKTAERWGVKGVRAHVPRDVGLALYFWLRLGYRPEEEADGGRDAMAMVRQLG
jgi:hypothetical protein